jgi:hypothetical protein
MGYEIYFFRFFTSNDKKWSNLYLNGQICIQTIEFEFKRTNQETIPHYRPSALAAGSSVGGTVRPGSNAGGTTRSGQAVGLTPAHPSRSTLPGDTTHAAGATTSGPG